MNAKTYLDEYIMSKILNIQNCHFFLCILKEKWGIPGTVVPVDLERIISDSDNIISKGLKLKTGAKIGFKIFSKSFSNFFDILQKYWRISNIFGDSPKLNWRMH